MQRFEVIPGVFLMVFLAAALISSPALAQHEDGPFGLGIVVGEPSGISAKYFFDERIAIDATAGYSFFNETAFHLHTDVLWHFDDKPGVDDNPWEFLFGFGFRYKFGDEDELAGIRVPIGFTYDFQSNATAAFFNVAPIFNFGSSEDFTVNASAGLHYYFD